MRKIVLTICACYLLATPQSAGANGLLGEQIAMACPGAKYVAVNEGKIIFSAPLTEEEEIKRCVVNAYQNADNFPVNSGDHKPATRVKILPNGNIKLY